MISKLSNKVIISVETQFNSRDSYPLNNYYLFTYKITIENKSDKRIQLLKRHWFITDSNGEEMEVSGEGVVGLQPIIEPYNKFSYTSACNLKSDFGQMEGHYLMLDIENNDWFEAKIPTFRMMAPFRKN